MNKTFDVPVMVFVSKDIRVWLAKKEASGYKMSTFIRGLLVKAMLNEN